MAAVGDAAGLIGGPDDQMRGPRPDLVVAARAAVVLGGLRAGHGPDQPVSVLGGFGARPTGGRAEVGAPVAIGPVTSRHPETVSKGSVQPPKYEPGVTPTARRKATTNALGDE